MFVVDIFEVEEWEAVCARGTLEAAIVAADSLIRQDRGLGFFFDFRIRDTVKLEIVCTIRGGSERQQRVNWAKEGF